MISDTRSAAQVDEGHELGGFAVGFFDPRHNFLRVGRVFEFDGDDAIDVKFLDGLEVGRKFHDAAARREVAMDFAVAIAEVHVDGFAFKLFEFSGAGVGKHQMADVDVGFDAGVIAFINEANHFMDVVEEAEAERFEFEGDVDAFFVSIIAEAAASFDAPAPLVGGRNDFTLPDILAEDEKDVAGMPRAGEVDEFPATVEVEFTDGVVEIYETDGDDGQGDDGEIELGGSLGYATGFLAGNTNGFGENVHGIEANAGDMFKAGGGIDARLVEGAIDDAEFHTQVISE